MVLAFDAFSREFGRGLGDERMEILGYFFELGERAGTDDGPDED